MENFCERVARRNLRAINYCPSPFMAMSIALSALLERAGAPTADRSAAERTIRECSGQWVSSNVTKDNGKVAACTADDYVGVGFSGRVRHDTVIVSPEIGSSYDVSDQIDQIRICFFGETAVTQGSRSWVKRSREPRRGRQVWINMSAKRGGRCEIIASPEISASPLAGNAAPK
jgi:hypothetical protein